MGKMLGSLQPGIESSICWSLVVLLLQDLVEHHYLYEKSASSFKVERATCKEPYELVIFHNILSQAGSVVDLRGRTAALRLW